MINYPNYLIEKIKTIEKYDLFPENGEFRLALHDIYLSKNHKKLRKLRDILAYYYSKKEGLENYSKAFEKSLTTLDFLSKNADEVYNFKNKEIEKFYKNSIKKFYKSN